MGTFQSLKPQPSGIYPLLLSIGAQEQAQVLPVQICLPASPSATVPGGCFREAADASLPTERGDSDPDELGTRSATALRGKRHS